VWVWVWVWLCGLCVCGAVYVFPAVFEDVM
jgi:hypothetical protein